MRSRVLRYLKRGAVVLVVVALALIAVRIYDTQRGPPLELWHTHVPAEMSPDELDRAGWSRYLAVEQAIFDDVRAEVTAKLDVEDRIPVNRYFDGSPVYPGRFARDWNRSYVLEPDGAPAGAAVFLHGLTDAPYSQRHIAERYRAHGYVAVAIRLPGQPAYAAQFALSHAGLLFTYPLAGWLGATAGLPVAFAVLGLIAAGAVLLAIRLWPRHDSGRSKTPMQRPTRSYDGSG
ncbi:MAG TPA: hypothetical protein VE597_06590 [Geminicoccaceae bacterium]|nr:hypothetical protein [Geminicoccaceae bacterium]